MSPSTAFRSVAAAIATALAAQEPAPQPASVEKQPAAAVLLGVGAHKFRWVADWGRLDDGKELGNTHGCMVVDKQGRILANTDTEAAVVVFAPDGRLFVGDGYGRSWVHLYDAQRKYLRSIGGPGKDDGKFQTPHGLWLDRRGKEPLLLVCDRENHRLQWFTLAGEFVRKVEQGLKRPCNVWPLADGGLAVADLVGRVTILGQDDQVVCHLGDAADPKLQAQNGVGREHWRDGVFFSPHSVCADRQGNLYVMDWNAVGRISKLLRVAD